MKFDELKESVERLEIFPFGYAFRNMDNQIPTWISIGLTLVVVFGLIILGIGIFSEKAVTSIVGLVMFVLGFSVIWIQIIVHQPEGGYRLSEKEWTEQYVIPYFDSEGLSSSPVSNLSLRYDNDVSLHSHILSTNSDEDYTRGTFMLNNDSLLKVVSGDFKLVESDVENPVASYNYLPEDVGDELDRGYYNVTIKVPRGYTID